VPRHSNIQNKKKRFPEISGDIFPTLEERRTASAEGEGHQTTEKMLWMSGVRIGLCASSASICFSKILASILYSSSEKIFGRDANGRKR
jgi:hypothetical protein